MSKEVGRSWHLSEGRRLLGAGQMRLLPRLGREVHAVRGHAGRHRSSQWRAPCRPGAQLAAAPRTEGANQGWRTHAREQGPQPATSPHPPSPTRKAATAGLSALNVGMPCAPGRPRMLALQCSWSACSSCSEFAPGRKTLRTSGGQTQNECGAQGRGGATRAWQCRAARQECGRSAAGVRQVGSPQLHNRRSRRERASTARISAFDFISASINIR